MVHCRKKPWDYYRNTHVRNLAWCLLSPSILASPYDGHALVKALTLSEQDDWLTELDRQPEALLEHMRQCRSSRIGLVFEHYWHFFWKMQLGDPIPPPWPAQCDEHTWLKNLQVNQPETHRTLGEADFVGYQQCQTRLVHRELAVKFYLAFPAPASAHDTQPNWLWLGPNCIDRLDKKLTQMSKKQLQLLHKPEAQSALPNNWQGLPIDSQIILRGQLFYPAHMENRSSGEIVLSQDHLRGYWYYPKDLLESIEEGEEAVILNKGDWLCTPALQGHTQITQRQHLIERLRPHLNKPEVLKMIEHGKLSPAPRPVMLSIGHSSTQESEPSGRRQHQTPDDRQGLRHWTELRRIFVVPGHWPDTSSPCFKT